jgi:hypothetical protein
METAAPAIMRVAMGMAVCSPPRPAMGADPADPGDHVQHPDKLGTGG